MQRIGRRQCGDPQASHRRSMLPAAVNMGTQTRPHVCSPSLITLSGGDGRVGPGCVPSGPAHQQRPPGSSNSAIAEVELHQAAQVGDAVQVDSGNRCRDGACHSGFQVRSGAHYDSSVAVGFQGDGECTLRPGRGRSGAGREAEQAPRRDRSSTLQLSIASLICRLQPSWKVTREVCLRCSVIMLFSRKLGVTAFGRAWGTHPPFHSMPILPACKETSRNSPYTPRGCCGPVAHCQRFRVRASLAELRELAKTLAWRWCTPRPEAPRFFDNTTAYLGVGKRQEVRDFVNGDDGREIEVIPVITPAAVPGAQPEVESGCEVMGRTMVILGDLPPQRAFLARPAPRVEIARLAAMAPRPRDGQAGRPAGAPKRGRRGRSCLVTADRAGLAQIRDRSPNWQDIDAMEAERATQRSRRQGARVWPGGPGGLHQRGQVHPDARVTGSEVLVANKPFATPDTTVWKAAPGQRALSGCWSATRWGFIKNLPHGLVASFKSTSMKPSMPSCCMSSMPAPWLLGAPARGRPTRCQKRSVPARAAPATDDAGDAARPPTAALQEAIRAAL